ncbi:histidine--tRNA ligase [Cuneatibacter caecimuris]|uniref:Histidine--tRNA ligase n=1 Tax=Cuneatibacter caecimuris TaxID=1796618 RepID=A0A4Q7PP05_9FIRM|nr:histidine--tRNA ligase [Cuneatibacter caecimuris]RZT02711.1 histidyl-tRNA synthetase [Cuneatibacter caecimuris]
MAMTKKPVTGMKDILPAEMQIRDYVIGQIKDTYRGFGFTQIETPCVESIGNLSSKQGGENEKLIFKILKRGEKLNLETAQNEADLVDGGLRYDLTVPLSRFYANHAAELPKPFKALQIGPVWRADRPQKGRFRQFYQCDIDILGDTTNLAEIELILATTTLLGKIGFSGFTVRVNDRRILKAMAKYSGFTEEQYDEVFIILDKMDKIGLEGVEEEMKKYGFPEESVKTYLEMFQDLQNTEDGLGYVGEKLKEVMEGNAPENLQQIFGAVQSTTESSFHLVFDPTLVRGMSYYTGTIFEIGVDGFPGSVAGGGRYDGMVGRFTGQETSACGFSIGFERIVTILLEEGFQAPGGSGRKAYLLEKNMGAERMGQILKEAMAERAAGVQVLVTVMNKNKKFQKEQLEKEGYTEFREFYREELKR